MAWLNALIVLSTRTHRVVNKYEWQTEEIVVIKSVHLRGRIVNHNGFAERYNGRRHMELNSLCELLLGKVG